MLPGDHACAVYSGEDERRAILAAYVRDGLDAGQRVAYLCGRPQEDTEAWLCDADSRLRCSVASGQLLLLGAGGAGPRATAVDPRRTLESLQIMADEAMTDGYPALRLAAEGAYLIEGLPADAVVPFERDLTHLVEANRMLALCAYSAARMPAPLLSVVVGGHRAVPGPRGTYEGTGLRITATAAPPGLRLAGELDRRHLPAFTEALAGLVKAGPMEVGLVEVGLVEAGPMEAGPMEAGHTIRLDMRSLTFIDVAAVTAIANTAKGLDDGRQVVLESPPSTAARILAKCWHGIPLPRLAIAVGPRPRAGLGTTWTAALGSEQPA